MIRALPRVLMFTFLSSLFAGASDWIPAPDRNCLVYVGLPLGAPSRWEKAASYDKSQLVLENGTSIQVPEVSSYLVVYANGEVQTAEKPFFPFPPGVHGLEAGKSAREPYQLAAAELDYGKSVCLITNSDFRSDNNGKKIYRTTLCNLSGQPIRILKFCAFIRSGDQFILYTVSGDFYTSDQFSAWYAVPADGWIPPGQKVFDDSNYGSGKGLWAYFGVTKSGSDFVATVNLPNP